MRIDPGGFYARTLVSLLVGFCGSCRDRNCSSILVLGRFGDMLLAVESHPAMLLYLDNARSIGPDSVAGLRQKRGLNENLAREIL
jgi:uncharacterized protein (DUF1800 family)